MSLEQFFGTWTLTHNDNFDAFLKHLQFGWIKRKAALVSNIEIEIKRVSDDQNALVRTVRSTFFNTEERYDLGGEACMNSDGVSKRHRMVGDTLETVANGTISDWAEAIDVNGDKMTVRRTWMTDGKQCTCTQDFRRNDI